MTVLQSAQDLQAEHRQHVVAIDTALTQLETALTAEKDFRRRCQVEDPEFFADLPSLKFGIKLSTNAEKTPWTLSRRISPSAGEPP